MVGKRQIGKKQKKEQLASSQLDKIVSQGKQAQLSTDFLQASEHKSAKVSVVFDMSEHTFHFPAATGTQLDSFFGSQQLPGGILQTPVVPVDMDMPVPLAPGTLFFEGTIAAIETGVEMDVGREAGFGFSGIVVVERQPAASGADEAVAFGVVGKILGPEGVIPVFGFSFLMKGGVLEVSVGLFLFRIGQVFFRAIDGIPDPVFRQATQLSFDFFQMGFQTSGVVGLLVDAETNDELVFGSQLHIVSRFGPGLWVALVLFHTHEGGLFICFRVTVASGQLLFLIFILFQPGQIILLHLPDGFVQGFVLGPLAQLLVQFSDFFLQPLAIDLGFFPQFWQVLVPVFFLLRFIHLLDLFQKPPNFLLHLLLITLSILRPHRTVSSGIRFQLAPVYKVVFQFHMPLLDQKLQYTRKHSPDDFLHHYPSKAVDGPEIRSTLPTQPHEVHILPQSFSNPTRRIQLLSITIHQHLQHHLGMVTAGAAPFVLPVQDVQVDLLDGFIDHSHHVVFRDQLCQVRRQQAGLAHEIRFKHDFVMTILFHAHIILNFSAFEEGLYNLLGQPPLAAQNALADSRKPLDLSSLPVAIFTDPQIATVGLTEAEARRQGYEVKVSAIDLEYVPRALAARDTRGFIKLVADATSNRLLGAHVLASNGGEVIQTAALAIKFGITIDDLTSTLFPYLTQVEGLKLAAIAFDKDVSMLSCCAG